MTAQTIQQPREITRQIRYPKLDVENEQPLRLITKLEAEASVDPVGTVGGLRIYIPARVAKDSQFPFLPGEMAVIRVVSDENGPVGLFVTKKQEKS